MSKKHDRQARQAIRDLLAGNPPTKNEPNIDYGPWSETIAILLEAHAEGGPAGVRQAWQILAKADKARASFSVAAGMYREMGMWFWLENMDGDTSA